MNKKDPNDKDNNIPSADGIQQNPFYRKQPKQKKEKDRSEKVIEGISKHGRVSSEIRIVSKSKN